MLFPTAPESPFGHQVNGLKREQIGSNRPTFMANK